MLRRHLLAAGSAVAVLGLASCSGSSGTLTPQQQYDMARAYLDTAVSAVLAAGQQYLAGPPKPSVANAAVVQQTLDRLAAAKEGIDASTTSVTDWKAGALDVLAILQQVSPLVAPFLGAAAPYVPLAIAVVTAFVQTLPPPPAAPVTPPAALAAKAMELHHSGR